MDNKYTVYQNIRRNRTYRTLGKMSLWRVVLGILLLIAALLISGVPSQYLSSHGHFHAARALMLSPGWMEKYKPEVKAYIEAGVLYQDGDYEAAYETFGGIEGLDAAVTMKSVSAAALAQERLSHGAYDDAYDAVAQVDAALLPADSARICRDVCAALAEHYSAAGGSASDSRLSALTALLETLPPD